MHLGIVALNQTDPWRQTLTLTLCRGADIKNYTDKQLMKSSCDYMLKKLKQRVTTCNEVEPNLIWKVTEGFQKTLRLSSTLNFQDSMYFTV